MSSCHQSTLFYDIAELLTLQGAKEKCARSVQESDLSIISQAALFVENGRIVWVGEENQFPKKYKPKERISLKGGTVLPGFVEAHTHTVFGGSRSNEFECRNQGASYAELAKLGGGILSTVQATRRTSLSSLMEVASQRIWNFLQQGVTTLEIKSGYGLDIPTEEKMLDAIAALKQIKGPNIVPTYLGAHTWPSEKREVFWKDVALGGLSMARQKGVKRADIFIEKGYFDVAQGEIYLKRAKELGFQLTVHAEQMHHSGGAALGVQVGACSVDHLNALRMDDVQLIAQSRTTAMLLPTADFYLKCDYPPARPLLDAGACVSLSTDFNPGSSPTQDVSFVGVLARLQMKMTLPEVIVAYTLGGAYALGLQEKIGSLTPNQCADFIVLKGNWRELFYHVGDRPIRDVYINGQCARRTGA